MPRCRLVVSAALAMVAILHTGCERPDASGLSSHIVLTPDRVSRVERVAFGSCWKPGGSGPAAFDEIVRAQPDVFLWLGDNIYGDTEDMQSMRASYDDKKSDPGYARFLEAEIPVLATWDDHDFGENNEGRYYPMRAESQQEFLRHYDVPEEDPRWNDRAGVYSSVLSGQKRERVHFILLDARYHRSPTFDDYGDCEGNQSTMLGPEQWRWLKQELQRESEIKIIASGIQVLPPLHRDRDLREYCAYGDGREFNAAIQRLGESRLSGTHYESWAEMPLERERLLRLVQQTINDHRARQVVFLSGDQHWAEIMRFVIPEHDGMRPVPVYEVTASGFNQKWPYQIPNPHRLPVLVDDQGNGEFDETCQFPFDYDGRTWYSCVTNHDPPRCYSGVAWGHCAPTGTRVYDGEVGTLPADVSAITTGNRYFINNAGSNFGIVEIDWNARAIELAIHNESARQVSHRLFF